MGGHSAPGGVASANWQEWTIGQALGKASGGAPVLGMPLVTLGQISKMVSGYFTGDWLTPMRDIMKTAQDPNGWTEYRTYKASEICTNCTVLSIKADIVYENGTRADVSHGLYLHHHASLNMGLHNQVNWVNMCANKDTTYSGINLQRFAPKMIPMGQILALAAVDEYTNYFTAKDGKTNSGFTLNPDDVVFSMTEVVNYANHEQKIYVQLDIDYVDGQPEKEASYTSMSFTGSKLLACSANGFL
jgi:hypothetical protein